MPESTNLPLDRPDRFRPPPAYAELTEKEPVAKVSLPDGGEAWLITGYAAAKAVLADSRIGVTAPGSADADAHSPLGEGASHQRFRRLVSTLLTARRVNDFQPRVIEIARRLVSEMLAKGHGVDLVAALARPLPRTVICELLGIEIEDEERFHTWVESSVALVVPPDDPEAVARYVASAQELWEFMTAAVDKRHREPDDGLLSAIIHGEREISADEVVLTGITVLITGYITTANALSVGIVDLIRAHGLAGLSTVEQLDRTAEEMLRRQSGPGNEALPRWACEHVEVAGKTIEAKDMVLVSLEAANHDPCQFAEPHDFELARRANAHLAFGYGRHHCLGAGLARIELRAAIQELAAQCPTLALATPVEEIPWTGHHFEDGPAVIPVTW
ncbi:cytochrome P450 [Kibdelosporangium persicum]|uniref:Cytochrome n=1 Tax=Kibdelosporangium persicum TaxID=2698649 RepID=A0ABX2FJK2_9PSEU|nr:cytochrome P450 [Kibdelosporangium persicum]NRN70966.1 Cytochrome [Kibdelosporangium persicum]